MPEEPIWIVVDSQLEDEAGRKVWGSGAIQGTLQRVPVDPATLEVEWNRMLRVVGRLIRQAEVQAGAEVGMQLDEVSLALEISGNGKVSLMGVASGEAASKGAITLKFKRAGSPR
jgi:hypothetical protein